MTGYAELGVVPVINASATLTRLGGSRMLPEVVQAMAAAACSFVDLNDLQRRVGARIAVGALGLNAIALNPQTVEPDEAETAIGASTWRNASSTISAGIDGGR